MAAEISDFGYIKPALAVSKLEVYGANILNVGEVKSTNATVVEKGDAVNHLTTITLKSGVTFSPAGAANLALGKQIYTMPAGKILIRAAAIDIKLQGAGVVNADTPEVGVGTVVGSGAVNVLGGTATFENIIEGVAAADCNGTATKSVAARGLGSSAAPEIFLNIADGWAGADTVTASGTIVLDWVYLGA